MQNDEIILGICIKGFVLQNLTRFSSGRAFMMGPLLLLFTVLFSTTTDLAVGAVSPTRINKDARTFAPGEIIWQDEFDYLDRSKWSNEINFNGGGNGEFQIYDDYGENAYVRDGILYMRPTLSLDTVFGGDVEKLYNGNLTLEGCTDENGCTRQANYPNINQPVVSQRLRTKGAFSFRYGHIVVRARMPSGDWTWPAIWMLPEDWKYGSWPASGEIDIVESRGNRNLVNPDGVNIGAEQMGSTLHYGPRWPYNGYWAAHGEKNTATNQGYDRDFHTYEVIWNTEMIQFSVDGTVIKKVEPPTGGFFELGQFPGNEVSNPWVNGTNPKMAPFDENFHFILNLAVGGAYFPNDSTPPPPWKGSSTPFLTFFENRTAWLPTWSGENAAMAVDYIRVYAA
ncbi:Beta-1,3-glucan-binding protein [Orchesella cincta]|uniref:Beta-1,3-glucan-binding protein n=1 Tax=Orchesella cincta TaxID=48709 RepID=A0A1D2NLJ2_ORCCI|nr:Beta-1,3-glucan-binding protein [Orchesella cincta]